MKLKIIKKLPKRKEVNGKSIIDAYNWGWNESLDEIETVEISQEDLMTTIINVVRKHTEVVSEDEVRFLTTQYSITHDLAKAIMKLGGGE